MLLNSFIYVSAVGSAGVSYLIKQNFEGTGYDNGESWTETVGNSTVDEDNTTNVVVGSQYLKLTRNTSGCQVTSPTFANQTEIWIYLIFRTSSLTNDAFILIQDSGGTTHAQLQIRSSSPAGGLRIYNNDALNNFQNTAAGMSVNTDYHIWGHWNLATGAADCEFQTTDTKVGSGNNFASLTGGDTT